MPDASPALRIFPGPGMSKGYQFVEGHYQAVPLLTIYPGPAGSMSASAAAMTQWVRFFLHDGHAPDGTVLLQPTSLREIETAHSPLSAPASLATGYGLANFVLGLKGKALFRGHNGGITGFISAFGYNRELGVGYAFSNNGDAPAPKLEKLVQAFLLRQQPVPAPLPSVPLDVAAVAPYQGHYRGAAPRNEMTGFSEYLTGGTTLRRQGDFLLNEPHIGKADTLLPTGPLTFRRPHEQRATMVLAQDKEGRQVLITSSHYAMAADFWWWLPPTLLALCGLLVLTSSLAALVGLVQVLRRKTPRVQLLPRLLPLLATSAMVTLAALASLSDHIWTAGQVDFPTVLFSPGPLVFVTCTVARLWLTVRYFGQFRRRAVAWYLLLTYEALGWLAAVLATYGWMSLRLWAV